MSKKPSDVSREPCVYIFVDKIEKEGTIFAGREKERRKAIRRPKPYYYARPDETILCSVRVRTCLSRYGGAKRGFVCFRGIRLQRDALISFAFLLGFNISI